MDTLRALPPNFKCADIICDFCGYLAQVKAHSCRDGLTPPAKLLGAGWRPQRERMAAGIYFSLFLVLVGEKAGRFSIHYLAADLQTPELFLERSPLGPTARRSGWQGFHYNLGSLRNRLIQIFEGPLRGRRTASEPHDAAVEIAPSI